MAFPFLQHCLELSYAWIFNEYPSFVEEDRRRFVSQETGHLYIAKVEPSDVGNYTCVVTSSGTAARVLGAPTPLLLRPDGTPRGAGPPEGGAVCAHADSGESKRGGGGCVSKSHHGSAAIHGRGDGPGPVTHRPLCAQHQL